ncbi:class I SAM-dependent methyltransferase [Acuticoccus sp. M5D2P5]|uniref:class I SAM-dependent methyltransferase n=1 Tax=Acuticoccus kalidii TaxID=2910977 RepID=UPI001F30F907|nr:class I SAM-dependent methyltransferase [Acuticoccus kalidii]MCF3933457.1 class I SAM-dependent methyltransferase [Acuticoccus kalidii]
MVKLHADGMANWEISGGVTEFIAAHCDAGTSSLETGAGVSTLAFAAAGARHTAVTPSADEIARIRAEAAERGIEMSGVTFVEGFSQNVLPSLTGPLDIVLIDGGHGFPIPAVDWTYAAARLTVGGYCLVDDIDIWTGQMLVQFMDEEDEWERVAIIRNRTAIFRLVKPFVLREWRHQRSVVAKSKFPRTLRRAKNAVGLIARGDLVALRHKFTHDRELSRSAKRDG